MSFLSLSWVADPKTRGFVLAGPYMSSRDSDTGKSTRVRIDSNGHKEERKLLNRPQTTYGGRFTGHGHTNPGT